MKRIHLTKDEKTLIRQFSRNNADCPKGMSQAVFVNTTILLKERGLASAEIGLMKVKSANLTDKGRSYLVGNPQLRNPFPWDIFFKIITVATFVVSFAALFVGCARLLAMQ